MNQQWSYPGARWWKFDFHTHTPASRDTRNWQSAIGTPNELKPRDWLLKFMAAEIDCVAITDHNSGEWIDGLKAAYADMKREADSGVHSGGFRELHLFPGVEISVQGGFHLLAIFDPSASGQTISDLLARVDYNGTRGDSDGVTREGAAKVIEIVHSVGGLAIPAHVDSPKGLLELEGGNKRCVIDSNTVKQVLQEPGLLALEWIDSSSARPVVFNELKLQFASVVGSDCHNFQGNAVPGSRYTWVKMAVPSLEGLRLALLDGQNISVRRWDDNSEFYPFELPEHFIESIEICNARYMGRGKSSAILQFNPYFNALIGGRGTGKSTVVHALRLAYRRDEELPENSESQQTFNRFNKVPKARNDDGGVVEGTSFCVRVRRDGMVYFLSWRHGEQANLVEELDTSTMEKKNSESQVVDEKRFPIRLFSQGQIASLAGSGHAALLKIIDNSANIKPKQEEFERVKRSFLSVKAQMRELEGDLQGRESSEIALQDVVRKLSRFEGTDHAEILKNYQCACQKSNELERQFEASNEIVGRLRKFASELSAVALSADAFELEADAPALSYVQGLHAAIDSARCEVERVAEILQGRGKELREESGLSSWFLRNESAKYAYEQLKAGLQQQGVNDPNEYDRLVQEKQRLQSVIKQLDEVRRQYVDLSGRADELLVEVLAARRAISFQRDEFLKRVLHDNSFVRIELIQYGRDIWDIDRSLREQLGILDGKFADDLCHGQEGAPFKGVLAELFQVTRSGEVFDGGSEAIESALSELKRRLLCTCQGSGDFGARFKKYMSAEAGRRSDFVDQLMCWFPEDGLSVEYSRKGDGRDFQSISQASAGQRAAAMLAFLLAHGSEPLVLDQPEDDLDNHLIYELVVQQIRSNKLKRQLIIVTHNPNIVVNGDAELIHVLDFNHQCYVRQSGSLQDQEVRNRVCQVMEGGKEAFERRYQRLGRGV